jgi:polyhydroxybutyrate depolymerase
MVVALAVAMMAIAAHAANGPSAPPCSARPTGDITLNIRTRGLMRNALLHVPAAGAGRRLPVVLAFHGAHGSGEFMADYSGFSTLADREHFVVVYPTAAGPRRFWTLNASDPKAPDDVAFISKLLQTLPRSACIDPARVYATGVSNGGGFTARLGCVLSSRIAAIAPVAGGYRSLDPCRPDRPVSVLEIHGTADPVVPYDGKPPDYTGSVPRFLANWASLDNCPPPTAPIFVAQGTERQDWGPCEGGTEVLHLRLSGVGHTWPGSEDSRSAPIAAQRTVWRFFRGRTLAPQRR